MKNLSKLLLLLPYVSATTYELRQGGCQGQIRSKGSSAGCHGFNQVDSLSVYAVDKVTHIKVFTDNLCKNFKAKYDFGPGVGPTCQKLDQAFGSFSLEYEPQTTTVAHLSLNNVRGSTTTDHVMVEPSLCVR